MSFQSDSYVKDTIRRAMSAPLLSVERELALTRAWRDEADEAALAELTNAHMRMAVSTAIKFRGYGLPLGDMIQEGAIGLLEAARRFDPDREVRFCTYAGWWIRASMQDYILRNWSIVRVGSKSAHKTIFFNLGRIRAMIEQADAAPMVARKEAADRFRVSQDDIEFMTSRLGARDQSLNVMLGEGGQTERQDLIPDERDSPDVIVTAAMDGGRTKALIQLAIDQLNEREAHIIKQRFFRDDKVTLSRLGTELSLSKERVRQIEKQAICKLKSHLAEQIAPSHLS